MTTTRLILRRDEESHEIDAFLHGDRIELHGPGAPESWSFRRRGDDRVELSTDRGVLAGRFHRDGNVLWLHAGGRTYRLEVELPGRTRRRAAAATRDDVLAPMTGTVRKVHVAVGDPVVAGDPVVVLEAMKMEHVLRAPRDGVVAAVYCATGKQAEAQTVLLRLEELAS